MKITKLNENSIRCFISKQEMDAQGINVDDLMDDRAKAEEFLRYILQQARLEVDFVTTGEALNVQLSVMNGGDISLMISDDQNAAIEALLAQFKDRLLDFQNAIAQAKNSKAGGEVDMSRQIQQNIRDLLAQTDDESTMTMQIWAELSSLDDCIRLAKSLDSLKEAPSSLYKYHETYYLKMDVVSTKRELAHKVFAIAEFSTNMYTDNVSVYGVEEHGKQILKDHAIKDLCRL